MNAFKGTKGKFKTPCGATSGTIQCPPNNVIFAGKIKIAQVFGETVEEANANTILFSKAPEMLKMLDKLREAILSEDYARMFAVSQSTKNLIKEATELK